MLLSCANLDQRVKQKGKGGNLGIVSSVSESCSFLNICFKLSLRKNSLNYRQFAYLALFCLWNVFMLPSV